MFTDFGDHLIRSEPNFRNSRRLYLHYEFTVIKSKFAGICIICNLFTFAYSAYPPPDNNAITLLSVTLPVSLSTKYPEHSNPITVVTPLGGGYFPSR